MVVCNCCNDYQTIERCYTNSKNVGSTALDDLGEKGNFFSLIDAYRMYIQ